MGNLSKWMLLLFTIMLSSFSISEDYAPKECHTPFQEIQESPSQGHLLGKKLNKTFSLHQSNAPFVFSVNHLPGPNPKDCPFNFLNRPFSLELSIPNIALQYLLHARDINRSLTIRDIIFPFHYFW